MKKLIFLICLLSFNWMALLAQNVGINADGSAPAASAMLDVKSTSKGFLAPRMTAEQKTAITSPATGLLIYQTDAPAGYYYYNGSAWTQIGAASGSSQWTSSGSDIYYNVGNVGIGTTTPGTKLHVDNGALYVHGIDNTANNYTLLLRNQNTDNMMVVYNDGSTFMKGNIGIGTTTPQASLDVNGVALSNYEGFSYYVNGLSVATGAWRDLVIPTLDYETFSTDPYNTVTGTFTAPRTGFYRFTLNGFSPTGTTGTDIRYDYGVAVNGNLKSFAGGNFSAGDTPMTTYTQVIRLTAGDMVTPRMYCAIDCTLGGGNGGYQFWFQGEFVGK